MRLRILVLTLLSLSSLLHGQRMPERWFTLNPLGGNTTASSDTTIFIHSVTGWGGFGAYRLARDAEHAWLQQLGAFIELLRIGNDQSLAFTSSIEFIADPHNDIRFNPRATFWEEGFLYTKRTGRGFWQIGYYHRCKHDVDNLILGKERSLIFGSVLGKYLLPLKINTDEALAAFRLDIYTLRQDDRIPKHLQSTSLNWKRLLASAGANVHVREAGRQLFGWYAGGWFTVNTFGGKESIVIRLDRIRELTFNGGVSAGIALRGKAHFRIGFTYEYLSDTGINPTPKRANLLSFGVTILDPNVTW
jgi:hypothetical protein